ncbi:hypothetical protein BC826DRAFT_1118315 [Russula brevipes]|nr:hypothetical protein BC826DRAFT_1118315 [Russula brevipes]
MQKLVFIVLAAFLGLISLVEGVAAVTRETNADRFARGLPPLAPVRRTRTDTAKRTQPSSVDTEHPQAWHIEARQASDGTTVGYVASDPSGSQLNLLDKHKDASNEVIHVEYSGSSLYTKHSKSPTPFYVGCSGTLPLAVGSPNALQLTGVESGRKSFWLRPMYASSAAIWNVDPSTSELTATWVNPDNSQVQPFFAYDPEQDALFLTGDFTELSNLHDPPTVVLVDLYLTH